MKKLLCVILMLTMLLTLMSTAYANEEEYIYIFNDNILSFDATQPPETLDGIVYVPMNLYLNHLGGVYIYDDALQTYAIFKGEKIISLNLLTNQVTISDGRIMYIDMYRSNGALYLPIEFMTAELGGNFSLLQGGICRVTTGVHQMTDGELAAIINSEPASYSANEHAPVYVMFRNIGGAGTDSILAQLENSGITAAFFITPDEITENPDLIRRIYIEGHSLGVYTSGLTASAALERANEVNRLLMALIKTNTNLILHPNSYSSQRATYRDDGFVTWDNMFNRTIDGVNSRLTKVLSEIDWSSSVLFTTTSTDASALQTVLTSEDGYRVSDIKESTFPIN